MEFDLMSSLDPVAIGRWLDAKKRGGCRLGGDMLKLSCLLDWLACKAYEQMITWSCACTLSAMAQHSAAVREVDVTLPQGSRPRGELGWGAKYYNGTSHKGGFPS
eukprot:1160311-Pelagomonas_calceolata.AAC.2